MFSFLDWLIGTENLPHEQTTQPEPDPSTAGFDLDVSARLLALELDNDRLRQRLHNLEQELTTLRRNLTL